MFQATLRDCNATRQSEWPGNDKIGHLFRAAELSGECGEMLSAFVAMNLAMNSGQSDEVIYPLGAKVLDELADVAISADLLHHSLDGGVPMEVERAVIDGESVDALVVTALSAVEHTKKYHRGLMGIAGDQIDADDLHKRRALTMLDRTIAQAGLMIETMGGVPHNIIAMKFNKTSGKLGLQTLMPMINVNPAIKGSDDGG